jgi:uncharacterized protein YgbK (DUF1537 family)
MLNDREKVLAALGEKPMKIFDVMKLANIGNRRAQRSPAGHSKTQSRPLRPNWAGEKCNEAANWLKASRCRTRT